MSLGTLTARAVREDGVSEIALDVTAIELRQGKFLINARAEIDQPAALEAGDQVFRLYGSDGSVIADIPSRISRTAYATNGWISLLLPIAFSQVARIDPSQDVPVWPVS